MAQLIFQQTVQSTDELAKKWPQLGNALSIEHVKAGLEFYRSKGMKALTTDKKTAEEALDAYNAVVADGRFVDLLQTDPARAAKNLGKGLRKDTVDLLKKAVALSGEGPKAISPGGVVIAVCVVLVLIAKAPGTKPVILDQSGIVKL